MKFGQIVKMGCQQSVQQQLYTAKSFDEILSIVKGNDVTATEINYAIYQVYSDPRCSLSDLRTLYTAGYKLLSTYCKHGSEKRPLIATTDLQAQKLQFILQELDQNSLNNMLFNYVDYSGYNAFHVRAYYFPEELPETTMKLLIEALAGKNIVILKKLLITKRYHLSRDTTVVLVNKITALDMKELDYIEIYNTPLFLENGLVGLELLLTYAVRRRYVRLFVKIFSTPGLINSDVYLDQLLQLGVPGMHCLLLLENNTDSHTIKLLNYAIDKKFYNTVKSIILAVTAKNNYTTLRHVYHKVANDLVVYKLFKTYDICYLDYQEEGTTQ